MRFWRGIRGRRPEIDPAREVDDELEGHLAARIAALVADGMSPDTARREAERRFGDVEAYRKQLRRLTADRYRRVGRRLSAAVWTEALRTSWRGLRRRPLQSGVAVLCLATGLGVVAALASVVDALVLRPPAGLRAPDRLVVIDAEPDLNRADVVAVAALPMLESVGAQSTGSLVAVRGRARAERVLALGVDGGYFTTLGALPAAGRLLAAEDDRGALPVAVVSRALAARQLDADPVGTTVRVEGQTFTVVGVAPTGFLGIFHGFQVDLWVPLSTLPRIDPSRAGTSEIDGVEAFARLAPGVRRDGARAAVATLAAAIGAERPAGETVTLTVRALTGFDPEIRSGLLALLALLLVAALALLAAAASPVAFWLVARAAERRRELGVRRALGGSGRAIAVLLAVEGGLLGLGGGLIGLAIAVKLAAGVPRLASGLPVPVRLDLAPRPGWLLAILGLAAITGAAAALPAIRRLGRSDLIRDLRASGGRTPGGDRRTRRLVLAQLAVVAALLIAAAGLGDAALVAIGADLGFDRERVVVVPRIDVGAQIETAAARAGFFARLVAAAAGLPGVEAAGFVGQFPLGFFGSRTAAVEVADVPPPPGLDHFEIDATVADEGYRAAAGIELLAGRDLAATDTADTPRVTVINQALAERFWPGEDALGQTMRIDGEPHRVVGVVATGRYRHPNEPPRPYLYLPLRQDMPRRGELVLRTELPPERLAGGLTRVMAQLAPDLPVPLPERAERAIAGSLVLNRVAAGILSALGALALLLAAVGVYAVVSWRVSRRRRELGVRLALGGRPADLVRALLIESLRLAAIGVAAGAGLGLVALELFAAVLPGVGGLGPLALVRAAGVLAAAVTLATLGPAVRAARTDPTEVLRLE